MKKTLIVDFEKGDALGHRLLVISEKIKQGDISGEGWRIQ